MRRRSFIACLLGLGLAPALPACSSGPDRPRAEPQAKALASSKFLQPTELETLAAALDRILPAGIGPSATEANVVQYVDAALANDPRLHEAGELIKRGLRYLDAVARRENANKRFHECTEHVQDAILTRFANADVPFRFPAKDFFEVTHSLALEGYFGHPRHHGNKDKVAWRWLGIDPSCTQMYRCDQ